MAFKMRGSLPAPEPIKESDRFNAHGLEGKIGVSLPLADALLYAAQCDPHRFQILA